VLHGTGNARLSQVIASLRDATRTLGASTVDRSRSLGDIADEHAPILDAVRRGDAEAAARTMAEHLTHTGQLLLRQALAEDGGEPAEADALWEEIVGEPVTPERRTSPAGSRRAR
jgi:DNA-binding GntR family transcriptional regulator